LLSSGAIKEAGSVERGTTTSDFDPLEKTWQHSLRASVVHLDTRDTRIHVVDTPGFPDFIGQAIGALDAVETAAIVVSAQSGIEMITSRMMEWAAARKLCRILVVNKIDAENVDLPALLSQIQAVFGRDVCRSTCRPERQARRRLLLQSRRRVRLLVGESRASGARRPGRRSRRGSDVALPRAGRGRADELHAPFERALREGHLVPVCFVSARTGAGVPELLDVLVKLAPTLARNPPLFYKGEGDAAVEFDRSPIRRSTCSPTCSRSSWIRSSASSASSASTRER
jgi:elongation factor G